jgi:hypothetical protein
MIAKVTSQIPKIDVLPTLSINQMKAQRVSISKLVNDSNNNLYYTVYAFEHYFVIKDRHDRVYMVSNANLDALTFDNIDLLVGHL